MTETDLIKKGWKYAGQCNCNATLNRRFTKDGYYIYLMPKRKQFYIKRDNNKVYPVSPLSNLTQAINSLYATEDIKG